MAVASGDDANMPNAPNSTTGSASISSASMSNTASNVVNKVQQPKPQALPARTGPTSILVSPRQKGNPVLNNIRQMPWEYSDIPADYVLGATTCALFLSLTYHRLHPEYVYNRIRGLQGKYGLRILLTMVDITNHEEPLKELSKTSLINNVTLILCWSAQEAGRYLELFKSYEHAAPTSIRAHQSTSYSDKLVEFITVPRSINKTDAVSLVSTFGSVRTAVNAAPEEIALVAGWGGKKVQRWCTTVREPFRVQKTARRGISRQLNQSDAAIETSHNVADVGSTVANRIAPMSVLPIDTGQGQNARSETNPEELEGRNGEALQDARHPDTALFQAMEPATIAVSNSDGLSEGVAAALEKLRRQ